MSMSSLWAISPDMSAVCRLNDVQLAPESTPFQRQYEVRTLHPLETVLAPGFFNPLIHNFRAGDRLHIVQYVNETWQDVVAMLPHVRIVSCETDVLVMMTMPVVPTGLTQERGFVITQGVPVIVRHDGWIVAQFNTQIEASELVKRAGYKARRTPTGVLVSRFGTEIECFPDARTADNFITGQL